AGTLVAQDKRLVLAATEAAGLPVGDPAGEVGRIGILLAVDVADMADAARPQPCHHQHLAPERTVLDLGIVGHHRGGPAHDGRERAALTVALPDDPPFDAGALAIERAQGLGSGRLVRRARAVADVDARIALGDHDRNATIALAAPHAAVLGLGARLVPAFVD